MFPVDNTLVDITGKFGPRAPFWANGMWTAGFHGGVDFGPEVKGTPLTVYAVADATVESVGRKVDAGNYIILRRPNGDAWRYCHLSSIGVKAGDVIPDGRAIGRMGTTGRSTGVHLHLECYADRALRVRVDPLPLIWKEPNPAHKASAPAPAPAPTKPPAPAPKPTPPKASAPLVLRLGAFLELRGWAAFTTSARTRRQTVRQGNRIVNRTITGRYKVIGIYGDSLKVSGPGGAAWVHSSARAGLVK